MTEALNADLVSAIDEQDDMFDSDEELGRSGVLPSALRYWKQQANSYWEANKKALKQQKQHRAIVVTAVFAGGAAVILAIVQLLLKEKGLEWHHGKIVVWIEFATALIAAAIVFWGIKRGTHHEWLLERHKAERFRMLKYRSILRLAALGMSESEFDSWKAVLHKDCKEIENVSHTQMLQWASVNSLPGNNLRFSEKEMGTEQAKEFIDYYQRKRLNSQTQYFFSKAERAKTKDWSSRMFPSAFFFLSILFVMIHFGMDLFVKNTEEEGSRASIVALLLIAGAASFPVFGAAVRTYRSAYEFSRNSMRFGANFLDLERIAERLAKENTIRESLIDMWHCEEILEREHREWLRLMTEAEWFG